jgi:hypothetical protein
MSKDVRLQQLDRPFLFASPFGGVEYALLLAVWAKDVLAPEQKDVSDAIVASGCRYAVCAGHGCSSWDESIDLSSVLAELDGKRGGEKLIMTTWHENEPLAEVVEFFFTHTAFDDFVPTSCLVLALGGTHEQFAGLEALVAEWTGGRTTRCS